VTLDLTSLRQDKLPKLISDEIDGASHEFEFSQSELNEAQISRRRPYPKIKSHTSDRTSIKILAGVLL